MLDADDAARSSDSDREIIPSRLIPADELGEIMHSRNETVRALREHERELESTLARLEAVAIDLHTKNRLLETARKNLEGADRLATMGMMSAGIAHELNTPLAVVKGLVSKLEDGEQLSPTECALLARVVGRIEKLSEGLLDFARVRTPSLKKTAMRGVIEDAWTLIKLDRQSVLPGQRLDFENLVPDDLEIACDPDRMVQVFVNLIRNSVHALRDLKDHHGRIRVSAERETRTDGDWLVLSVLDNGSGIDPAVIDTLFEPFVSSRMDANGTGLGLAVADGIVREHGGMVVPSNVRNAEGAVESEVQSGGAKFDVHLPVNSSDSLV
jgi:two-component system NtrC family sensor kinase